MFHRLLSAFFDPESVELFPRRVPALAADVGDDDTLREVRRFLVDHLRRSPEVVRPEDRRVMERRVETVLDDAEVGWDPFRLLLEMSRFFLTERDALPAFRFWDDPSARPSGSWRAAASGFEKVALWQDLGLRMDVTPVLAASFVDHNLSLRHPAIVNEAEVALCDQEVGRILDEGLAETHLHLTASFSYRSFLQRLLQPRSRFWRDVLDKLNRSPSRDPVGLPFSVTGALAAMLQVREMLLCRMELVSALACRCAGRRSQFRDPLSRWAARLRDVRPDKCSAVAACVDGLGTVEVREYFNRMSRRLREAEPAGGGAVPGAFSFRARNETAFLTCELRLALGRASGPGRPGRVDGERARWLLLYLQLKNALHRAIVQEKGFPGFQEFREKFTSMDRLAVEDDAALDAATSDPRVRTTEVRISPGDGRFGKLRTKILTVLRYQRHLLGARDGRCSVRAHDGDGCPVHSEGERRRCPFLRGSDAAPTTSEIGVEELTGDERDRRAGRPHCRIGVVVHFVKPSKEPGPQPGEPISRFDLLLRPYARDYLQAAANLLALRRAAPRLASYLVGVDVANVETALPNYVFYPAISILREAWTSGTQADCGGRQSLGLTFHAGEDFFDIVSALREIAGVVEAFRLRAGDRIGHGFAAGADVDWWCRRHTPSCITLEDLVFDRLWEWHLVRQGLLDPAEASLRELELKQLAGDWLGNDRTIALVSLLEMYRLRHEAFHTRVMATDVAQDVLGPALVEQEMTRLRRRLGPEMFDVVRGERERSSTAALLNAYFSDPEVRKRGAECRHVVHTLAVRDRVRAMQVHVCKVLASRGVFVEANPTSNYVILRLARLSQHPIFRWCRPGGDLNVGLKVSLNTDNPVVFQTTVSDEFSLVFYAALDAGMARDDALAMVDDLRRNNLRSTFVRRTFGSTTDEMLHLCGAIDQVARAVEPLSGER